MSKKIKLLDLLMYLMETVDSPKHVGALLTFEAAARAPTRTAAAIVAAYRAAKAVPPFNYVPDLSIRALPSFRPVRSMDMDYHVQHLVLPAGASQKELLKLVADLHEPMLDRNRPGFRVHVIEGLPGQGLAIYLKVHHGLVDGQSVMARIVASLNDAVNSRQMTPFYAVEFADTPLKAPGGFVDRLAALQSSGWSQTVALKDFYVGAVKKGVERLLNKGATGSLPFAAPRLQTNEAIRTPRNFAILSLPLAEMKTAGKAFGGTINDAAATVTAAGLTRYLQARGSVPKQPLVAMCPVSLRSPGDTEATTKASAVFVPLGATRSTVGERMREVVVAMTAAKQDMRAMSNHSAMIYGISAISLGELVESSRLNLLSNPLANYVLSNVPGTPDAKFLNGARMTGLFPISALAAGIGLNVTLSSYAGSIDFGFVGNGLSMPDLSELADCTRAAFDELKAAALEAATPSAAKQRAERPKRVRVAGASSGKQRAKK